MVIAVVGLGVGLWGWRVLAEREALAQLPSASANAPNVLLIVLDTVRAQNLSLYGYARVTTPQLEQLAKTGVVFERALATAPWTLPSHASIFTGRYPYELSTDWTTPLDSTHPTLAEVFSAHGYVTAGFVANLLYCTYESGFTRGFAHYEDYPIKLGTIAHSSWLTRIIFTKLYKILGIHQKLVHKTAAELNTDLLRWLTDKDQRPFFVFLNYFDAHAPYAPPQPFDAQFAAKPPRDPWLRDNHWYSPEEIQELMDAYDGAIAYLDHQLGLLFSELAKRDVLNDTLVIITSDHGEEFGEHGLMDHGNSLYLPALHVPLLISFPPHVPAGKRVHEAVTLRNLPATITDLIELNDKAPFPGSSLIHYWSGTHSHDGAAADPLLSEVNFAPNLPEWFPVSKGNMKSLVANRYHYIRNGDGREELYDIENDPLEQQDTAYVADDRHMLAWLRAFIERILGLHRLANL